MIMVIALCLLIASLSTACALTRLSDDLKEAEPLGLVYAPVSTPTDSLDGVVVLLYRSDPAGPQLDKVDVLTHGIDTFVFPVDSREAYRIVAFQDLDGDLVCGPSEPFGGFDDSVRIEPAQQLRLEPLTLTRGARLPSDLSLDLRGSDIQDLESLPFVAGEIAQLDSARFSDEKASEGIWQPMQSSLDSGAGVYFLEEYDPARIPILFVHGVGGTPRDFTYFIEHLDREKYQVWYYTYPSGARLHTLGQVLKGLVRSLHNDLHFDTLYVTAHSMGGLVARSFILQAATDGDADFIKLYVSFSTPYNGHEGAAQDIKFLSRPVPSWIDMAPDSEFLVALRELLPPNVPFYLFFGYDAGGFNVTMSYSSDSVIALRSQLASFAQNQAVRTWGYDRGHVSILYDPEVFARYSSILDEVTEKLTSREDTDLN